MQTRRLHRSTLVLALAFCASLPPEPARAQGAPRAAFTAPSTRLSAIETQQTELPVLCLDGLIGRAIIVQNFTDLAGALVTFTVAGIPAGVVEFSLSLAGPFTDTIEVPIQLDGTGSGVSDVFVVKGVGPGLTSIEGCSPQLGCVPSPFIVAVMAIVGLDFVMLDSSIDANPNTGGGVRMFPDRESPQDSVDRRTVRVQAFTNPQLAGLSVSFRSFDVDDPSSDSRPVDANGPRGEDNRGAPRAGSLNPLVSQTDASGVAETIFTVTVQPGDNFRVAAACDPAYLQGLIVTGTDLQDANGNLLPTNHGRSSEMLTVWRRVHVEVDSMGLVSGNLVAGAVTEVAPNQKSLTTRVKVDQQLEAGRFEGGRLEIAGVGSFNVTANDKSSVTLPGVLTEGVGRSFSLWDDDDFNGDDGGPLQLDGDEGENVTAPVLDALADSLDNGVCDYSSTNVFGPAYVCPVFDLIVDHDDLTPFALNVAADTTGAILALYTDFDNRATERDPTFWTVYVLGAYQYTIAEDLDPNPDPKKKLVFEKNATMGVADELNGQGAVAFKETIADNNRSLAPGEMMCDEALVTAHEVGHLFGGIHRDGGLMSNSCEAVVPEFREPTIDTIRKASHP